MRTLLWLIFFLAAVQCKITGHVLIHSHVDAGWVRTFEKIYQETGKKILSTLSQELYENEAYRLNWADHLFLDRWWYDKDVPQELKDRFMLAFQRGQIQFVHPGMIMADEAMVSWTEAMENFDLGLHFLRDVFGVTPHVAWALDTFGMTVYTPALLEKYNIDTVYVSRISGWRRVLFHREGIQQVIWQGHPVAGHASSVFTILSQFGTYAPNAMAFDTNKLDRDCKLEDLKLVPPKKCLEIFYWDALADHVGKGFLSKNFTVEDYPLAILWGDDGAFTDAGFVFGFINKFIEVFNKYSKEVLGIDMELRYSTMDEYLQELKALNLSYPVYRGDFLPEIENPILDGRNEQNMEYWNGYYSNCPVYKTLIRQMFKKMRQTQAFLAFAQVHNQLRQNTFLEGNMISKVMDAQIASVVNLHHDAVTGTHTVNVNYDYVDKIARANTYSDQQISLLSDHYDSLFSDGVSLYRHVPADKLSKANPRVVKVFNPDIKAAVNESVNITIEQGYHYLVLDEDFQLVTSQVLPQTYYDNYHKLIAVNKTHADLFFLFPRIEPMAITKIFLFTFSYQRECRNFYLSYVENLEKPPDELCMYGTPSYAPIDQNSKKFPFIQIGDQVHLTLHRNRGLLARVKHNGVWVGVKQEFEAYIFWDQSNSGFYVFEPNRAPVSFREMTVDSFIQYDGPIFSCLHAFISKARPFNTILNAYFENRVCVQVQHPERIYQRVSAKSIIGYEILLRTEIISALSETQYPSLKFYTLDSLYAMERMPFSREEAYQLGLTKTFEERGIPYDGTDPYWQANTYPCNSGLIIEDSEEQIAMGLSYQHGLMCQFPFNSSWYVMLTRATQNQHFQQGIHDQQDDFGYSTFDISFLVHSISGKENVTLFQDKFNEIDFHQNMGLLTIEEPLSSKNSYRTVREKEVVFMAEHPHLKLLKTHYDPHLETIYLTLLNNHNDFVPIYDLNISTASNLQYFRCLANDILYCSDPRFYQEGINMLDGIDIGANLDNYLSIWPYNIFELRGQELPQVRQDLDANVVPPLAMVTLVVTKKHNSRQYQPQGDLSNHFSSSDRDFYWSQRRYVAPPINHVTCFKWFGIVAFAFFYVSLTFLVYAFYIRCCEPSEDPHKLK